MSSNINRLNRQGNEAALDRQHLLKANAEKITIAYREALKRGSKEPCVIVLDVRDPFARALAETQEGADKIAAMIRSYALENMIPTLIIAVEREVAAQSVGKATPNGTRVLMQSVPSGMFYAVAIAAGGNSYCLLDGNDL